MLLYKRHIFHKGLNAIYIALEMDKSLWAKRAKAETNSRSEKSLVASYHSHSLPVSNSRYQSRAVKSWEGLWLDDQKQEAASHRAQLGPEPELQRVFRSRAIFG